MKCHLKNLCFQLCNNGHKEHLIKAYFRLINNLLQLSLGYLVLLCIHKVLLKLIKVMVANSDTKWLIQVNECSTSVRVKWSSVPQCLSLYCLTGHYCVD